ncbi:MAG TPA: alpha/beta hydrolase [Chitinophagaceae bacterium]|nr:alpha/beta hydrolase [Chitinophagaceae bacterium]
MKCILITRWLNFSRFKDVFFLPLFVCISSATKAQNDSTSPPYPAPGKLVDVGGWKLHINATGRKHDSLPTVILESGAGDFSVEWSLVQPEVAKFTRVCSYDRAGDGWSEWGPHPRTFHQIVYELHTLLMNAGEKPPFVFVAHSYGGWLVRLYAITYPQEVVGMVLVETGGDDPLRMMPDGKLKHVSELVKGDTIPAVKTSGPLKLSDIPPAALDQIRSGLHDASVHANDPPRNKLPLRARQMRTWALGQIGHIVAAVNPYDIEELAQLRTAMMKRNNPFGDMPIIVLTRGLPEELGANAKYVEDVHRKDQEQLASLSSKGKLIVAEKSAHHIQIEQPELVIQSIHEVVVAARKK